MFFTSRIARIASLAAFSAACALPTISATAQNQLPDISNVAPASEGNQLRAAYLQSSGIYMQNAKHAIPYRQEVRLVSNLYEFPEKWDPVAEQDFQNQFHEFLFSKYPKEFEKLKGHNSSSSVQTVNIIKGREQQQLKEYASLLQNQPGPGRVQREIIYVEGFKYVPRANKGGLSAASRKASELMSGVKQ